MQSVSSRIWICVAVSISYDDNHYTTDLIPLLFFDKDVFGVKEPMYADMSLKPNQTIKKKKNSIIHLYFQNYWNTINAIL